MLYPLSYEGGDAGSLPRSRGFQTLRSGNSGRMSSPVSSRPVLCLVEQRLEGARSVWAEVEANWSPSSAR